MMQKRHTPQLSIWSALLAGLLAACGTGAGTPGTSSVTDLQFSDTAQGWTGGTAALRAIGTNRDENYPVGFGSIAANGDFTLELLESPNTPDSFGPLTCDTGETGEIEVTPSTLRVTLVRSFGVTETEDLDDPEIGEVVHIKGDPAGNDDFTLGMYAYASAPGTVKGTCVYVGGTSTHIFDLTLVAGWNHVIASFTDPIADSIATYRTAPPPEDLRWVYHEFPPDPNDGPPPPPGGVPD